MSRKFPPHRNSHAAVSVRFLFVSLIDRRLIALLLITLLAFPAVLVRPREAGARITLPSANSAPPESFAAHEAETRVVASVIPQAIDALSNLTTGPTIPPGFETAKLPSFTERLVSNIKPVFALIAPTKPTTRTSNSEIEAPPPTGTVLFDFDGDGKADIGRWQASSTEFKVRNSGDASYSTYTIGSSAAVASPGDFDGDGKTDAAVFNAGAWTIKKSSNGATQNISWGTSGDKPVAADYDGDGKTDAAVFRPSTNAWWILKSSDSNYTSTTFGSSGDIPLTGNWDGDSYADLAVFRPSNGNWYVQRSTAGSMQLGWGLSTDVPVPADFDGDNKTDLAVYRPSTGVWWVMKSSTAFDGTHFSSGWGNYGDQPAPADYDEDGKADLAVWRPKTGVWYIAKSSESFAEYEYYGLGVAGDAAVPSAYIKQVATSVYGDDMANARLSPKNETGATNLYSRNFSWGTQLVGLPGRSGLDAGFGIGYNSLVWTKLGSDIHFDVDQSNVTPGFRFGFPTIEAPYYDDGDKKLWSLLMVTPSGSRVEFRQTAVSNIYETADSNYTQLKIDTGDSVDDPPENIGINVTTTDGTVMTYEWLGGAYRCKRIKDRNGNYITIDHDDDGTLRTITDTLGRVITVNYDSQLYPTSITQVWKDNNGSGSNTTHTWATFTYTTKTVATSFGSLTIVGPPNDTVIKVLQKITYADGSYTKFTHNGYIQVEKVENFAADDHLLNHVRTNLDSVSGTQSDCPRFSATYTKIDNFNVSSGVPQEIEVTNSLTTSASYSLPGSLSGTATRIDVAMTGHPDGLYSRTFVAESGWKEGLTLATEDCTGTNCSDRKRWTWTDWTQDDTGLSYPLNPRVIESRVGDGTNTKKSTIEYWLNTGTTVAIYGLVKSAYIFDTDLSTILKKTYTTYNLDSAYSSRRIIGLPSMVEMRDGSEVLWSKVTYAYDEGSFSDSSLQQSVSPTQHDGTNYGSSFTAGRGNLTSITRWNVEYPTNSTYAVTSSVKYNTAGSPVARISPWDGTNTRIVRIGYTDYYNSSVGVSTYAYPTVITDPAGTSLGDSSHSSTVKYRYDMGANVEANSPAPAGNSYGKKTKRVYDSVGRLERDSIYINTTEHNYTRYEYPTNGIQSKVYSTLVDTDSDGADADDEVLSETFVDGAGRVRLARTPHTFSSGSTATWAGVVTEYDILGRVHRQSVPTEVNSSWAATGDDVARGFLWTYQEYDWMNRVTRKVKTDGDPQQSNASDVLISYSTCGCAGGLVTTIQGEEIIEKDWSGTTTATPGRRTQKVYQDIIGRTFRTEVMKWNGTDPYLRTETTFNGRDQAVEVHRTDLDNPSSPVVQTTTMGYDGHGRMVSRHIPQQDAEAETEYAYNPDDSVWKVWDAREVRTDYVYNSRGLLEEKSYTLPGESEIPATSGVSFSYDNLGNRTNMTDGLGEVDYEYTSLSQLSAETRDFTDTLSEAPSGVFRLEYTYTIGGQLKSLEDPYSDTIYYAHDKLGRLSTVTGNSFGGVTSYANSPHYRAWGGLQSLSYGNSTVMSMTFDNRLRADHSQLVKNGTTTLTSKDYSFYSDGSLRKLDDLLDNRFDRVTKYDNVGRPREATSGLVARDGTPNSEQWYDVPYVREYTFNAFGNFTGGNNHDWGIAGWDIELNYTNNRLTNGGSYTLYDVDGRQTQVQELTGGTLDATYDARGLPIFFHKYFAPSGESEITRHYDGDGREAKREKRNYVETEPDEWEWGNEANEYYIRSTVLGGEVISNAGGAGEKVRTYVRVAGSELAWQNKSGSNEEVVFQNWDPSGLSYTALDSGGTVYSNYGGEGAPAELEPAGGNVGTTNGISQVPGEPCVGCGVLTWEQPIFVNGQPMRFNLDGMDIPYSMGIAYFEGKDFALIQWQRNASLRFGGYTLRFGNGDEQWAGYDLDGAIGQMEGGETLIRNWYVSNVAWGLSLGAFQTRNRYASLHDAPRSKYEDIDNKLLPRVTKALTDHCKKKLNELLGRLKSKVVDISDLVRNTIDGSGPTLTVTDEPIRNVYKRGFWVGAKPVRSVAPSGETIGNSIVLNRNILGKNYEVLTFIHELLHTTQRGGEGHARIAREIADMEGVDRNLKKFLDGQKDADLEESRFINSWLNENCAFNAEGVMSWKEVLKTIGVN